MKAKATYDPKFRRILKSERVIAATEALEGKKLPLYRTRQIMGWAGFLGWLGYRYGCSCGLAGFIAVFALLPLVFYGTYVVTSPVYAHIERLYEENGRFYAETHYEVDGRQYDNTFLISPSRYQNLQDQTTLQVRYSLLAPSTVFLPNEANKGFGMALCTLPAGVIAIVVGLWFLFGFRRELSQAVALRWQGETLEGEVLSCTVDQVWFYPFGFTEVKTRPAYDVGLEYRFIEPGSALPRTARVIYMVSKIPAELPRPGQPLEVFYVDPQRFWVL